MRTRPGSTILSEDYPQLPSGNQIVNDVFEFQTNLFLKISGIFKDRKNP